MIDLKNLISLADRPPNERREIARKGGSASGRIRKENQIQQDKIKLYLMQEELKDTIKSMHFRNSNTTPEQVKTFKVYFIRVKQATIKLKRDLGEDITEYKEAFKSIDYKDMLNELAKNKEYYVERK